METPYYLQKLTDEFCKRQKLNSAYSLRAFARDLSLDSSELSSVLRGKRKLPIKKADAVCRKLRLSPLEKSEFVNSLRFGSGSLKAIAAIPTSHYKELLNDETHFRIISEWEYFCLLSLVKNKKFKSDPEWIASRLDVSLLRVKNILDHLLTAGLIEIKNGKYVLIEEDVKTTEDISSAALRRSHHEALEMGAKKLDEIPLHLRDFSSATIPIKKADLPKAKELIREFRHKLDAFLSSDEADEVYQIAIQFYPLTKTKGNTQGN